MADFFFPTNVIPARSECTYIDSTARFQSPLSGAVRTVSRPGERLRLRLDFVNLSAGQRSQLQAMVAKLRGGANRVYVPLHGMAARGSFPSDELFVNSTFTAGIDDWATINCTASLSDGVVQIRPTYHNGGTFYKSVTVPNLNRSYIVRSFTSAGRGMPSYVVGPVLRQDGPLIEVSALSSNRGLLTVTGVVTATPDAQQPAAFISSGAFLSGDYVNLHYATMQQCAQIDGGGNLLLRSEDFTTTWANTRTTDAANSLAAPDGTTTADSVIEDSTASNTHYIQQSATVAATVNLEYCGSVYLKAGTRTWAAVVLLEGTGSTAVRQYVNLSTGALGTLSAGANWSNQRAFVTDAGNGWYRVDVVARKINTATSVSLRVELATGNGTNSYTGNGTSLIYAWGGQLNQSSNPVRYTATTTAAVATASQTGTGLYLKGLPTSTNGLLVAGDWVEIGGELHQVAQALNSDGHGLGYLVLSRPVRAAKTNETPVIVGEPLGKFLLEDSENGWVNEPGNFSSGTLTFIEDIAA